MKTKYIYSGKAIVLALLLVLTSVSILGAQNNKKNKPVKVGDQVPSFILKDQTGNPVDIKSVIGKKKLVLYFYPKDDTPGCTKEACSFRDQYEVFNQENALVIGISGQSVESHKAFAEKYHLSFTLLSDEGNKVRNLFGVPTKMGMIPGRVTYIVDLSGKVVYIFNSLSESEKHVSEAIRILKGMK